jgi:hypothetical protein
MGKIFIFPLKTSSDRLKLTYKTKKNKKKIDVKARTTVGRDTSAENAFSPLPARTKASNADMTACLPLQDCIVHSTRLAGNFCRRAAVQLTRLPAYGRIISRRYMVAARLQWQVLKLHVCSHCAAAAVSQTAYKRSAVTCRGRIPNCMHVAAVALLQCSCRIPNCMHARLVTCCSSRIPNCMHAAAVALLQWQDTKQHARMDALLQWQVLNRNYGNLTITIYITVLVTRGRHFGARESV